MMTACRGSTPLSLLQAACTATALPLAPCSTAWQGASQPASSCCAALQRAPVSGTSFWHSEQHFCPTEPQAFGALLGIARGCARAPPIAAARRSAASTGAAAAAGARARARRPPPILPAAAAAGRCEVAPVGAPRRLLCLRAPLLALMRTPAVWWRAGSAAGAAGALRFERASGDQWRVCGVCLGAAPRQLQAPRRTPHGPKGTILAAQWS